MSFVFEWQDGDDFRLLQSFFAQLHHFLQGISLSQRYRDSGLLFPEDMRSGEFLPGMFKEAEREFSVADEYLRSESSFMRTPLQRAGLTGPSLHGKLRVLEYWSNRISAPNIVLDQLRKFLGKVLASINTLLGSFVAATGVGELIKELKETIENMLPSD